MLRESLNNPSLATESIFFYIGPKFLTPNYIVGDLYKSLFQNGDFLIVEYQEFQNLF
jgi:hypothetical protein